MTRKWIVTLYVTSDDDITPEQVCDAVVNKLWNTWSAMEIEHYSIKEDTNGLPRTSVQRES